MTRATLSRTCDWSGWLAFDGDLGRFTAHNAVNGDYRPGRLSGRVRGSYGLEAARDDGQWAQLCRAGTWFVALHLGGRSAWPVGRRRVGRAGGVVPGSRSGWRRGTAARGGCPAAGRGDGLGAPARRPALRIWVLDRNDVARAAWERLGSRRGEHKPLRSDPGRTETRYRRPIAGPER